jgi:phosphatidylinositol alpha-mannosyltransferase
VVGMVANFRPRKGAEILIEAVAAVTRAGRPLQLVMIGEPFRDGDRDYGAVLRAAVERAGLAERTTFTGFRPDVAHLIAGLDLFVLPSLFGEGLPMALLEAMGSGVAVLTTPVEGIVEVVQEEQNGLLVPAGDVDSLAAAIERLVADPDVRARLAAAGRETVADRYSADRMARGFEAVYEELGR